VKEEAVISAQCHSTLKELIILWTVNGHPLDGRIKRWSLPSVRPSVYPLLATSHTRQVGKRTDPNYFHPLPVRYSVTADDRRSSWPSGP